MQINLPEVIIVVIIRIIRIIRIISAEKSLLRIRTVHITSGLAVSAAPDEYQNPANNRNKGYQAIRA